MVSYNSKTSLQSRNSS